nr:hypothetical protein [Tanacetum cinerariifolium]
MESHSKKMKVQWIDSDIISTVPQSITENILIRMPIRDAVRTSILSRNWRCCWKSLPKLVFDDKSVEVPSNCKTLKKLKLVSAILHVLLQHTGSILEFHLNVGELDMDSEFDQIICYLSRNNNLKTLDLDNSHTCYKLPSSFFQLQGLKYFTVKNCDFEPPSAFNGFSRLKCLRFNNVEITSKRLQRVLSNCPLLTEVVLLGRGRVKDFAGGNKFTFVELFECAPLVKNLAISEFYMKHLAVGGMLQELPSSLVHVKLLFLDLHLAKQDEISSALCLMRSSPNLKQLTLVMRKKRHAPQASMNLIDFHDYSCFNLDHLEDLQMLNFRNLAIEFKLLKLIMAKSPVLNKVRLELSKIVSVDEELKILRDFIRLPFPRASPSATLTIERP